MSPNTKQKIDKRISLIYLLLHIQIIIMNNLAVKILVPTFLSGGIGGLLYQHSQQSRYHEDLSSKLNQFCKNKNTDMLTNLESSFSTTKHVQAEQNTDIPTREVTTVNTPVHSLIYSEEFKHRPINFWINTKRLRTFFGRECYNLFVINKGAYADVSHQPTNSQAQYVTDNLLEYDYGSERTFKYPSVTRTEGLLSDEVIKG